MIACTDPAEPSASRYAEGVYESFEAASGGRIAIDVTVLGEGRLADVSRRPLVEVLGGLPAEWIVFSARGPELIDLQRGPRNPDVDEWAQPPELADFDAMGYPVERGVYRLLHVRATLDGVASEHGALEACWTAQDHCVVIDPMIMQLDGYYQNRQRWLAEGWAPVETAEGADALQGTALAGSCKLLRFGTTSKTYYWPALYAAGYNALGWKLYEDYLGAQWDYIGCYASGTSCKAAASTTSYSSSCSSDSWGWNCDCANVEFYGYTGSTAKTAAQTKCVNNWGGVSITAGISGGGASFAVTWNVSSGSVYTNGGTYTDTCAWQ